MNGDQPTHGEILEEIRSFRAEIAPVIEMQADLSELVEITRALKLGGKGIKGLATVATALLTIGGMLLAIRGLWQSFWQGG